MHRSPQIIDHTYTDTEAALARLTDRVRGADRVALDTEADSLHHYYQKVCLIQLTIDGEHHILDPLADMELTDFLEALADTPLILHGGEYDLRMMRSSMAFRPRREVFDTLVAAQLLGYEKISLVDLVNGFFGTSLTKQGRKSNWARRPLSAAQLRYAIDDTRYLPDLADRLAGELADLGRTAWHREACERMIENTEHDNPRDPDALWRIKGHDRLERRELLLLRELWGWRESEAQRMDRPPFKVMANKLLVDLAVWAAAHPKAPLSCGPKLPRNLTGARFNSLEATIRRALAMPKSQWPDHRRNHVPRPNGPDIRPLVDRLRRESERIAQDLNLDPAVLAPRAAMVAVARHRPQSTEEIMSVTGLMRWQVGLVEADIRRVLANADTILEGSD